MTEIEYLRTKTEVERKKICIGSTLNYRTYIDINSISLPLCLDKRNQDGFGSATTNILIVQAGSMHFGFISVINFILNLYLQSTLIWQI